MTWFLVAVLLIVVLVYLVRIAERQARDEERQSLQADDPEWRGRLL